MVSTFVPSARVGVGVVVDPRASSVLVGVGVAEGVGVGDGVDIAPLRGVEDGETASVTTGVGVEVGVVALLGLGVRVFTTLGVVGIPLGCIGGTYVTVNGGLVGASETPTTVVGTPAASVGETETAGVVDGDVARGT